MKNYTLFIRGFDHEHKKEPKMCENRKLTNIKLEDFLYPLPAETDFLSLSRGK
jgi:hypothetical protein